MAVKTLDVDALVGMDLPEAKKLIFSRGWRYRVIREDGQDFVHTADARSDRINLTVASKIVTDATIG